MKIGFTYNKSNIFSKLIGLVTKSKWSHCFIITDIRIGNDTIIIESSFHGGCKVNVLSNYQDSVKFNLKTFDISTKIVYNISSILPYIGSNYGCLEIVGFLIAKIFRLKQNPFTKDTVCSELVLIWLLNQPDLAYLFKDLDVNKTSPQDLIEIVSKNDTFISE